MFMNVSLHPQRLTRPEETLNVSLQQTDSNTPLQDYTPYITLCLTNFSYTLIQYCCVNAYVGFHENNGIIKN